MSQRLRHHLLPLLTVTALLVAGSPPALEAQVPALPVPQVETPPPVEPEVVPVAPDSPLASLRAFLDAADAGNWDEAARYLSVPPELAGREAELAERLKAVIDSRRLIDLDTISGESSGDVDDDLPARIEEVDVLRVLNREDAYLRLVETADADGRFWAFSAATVLQIDSWYSDLPDRWLRDALSGTRFSFLLLPGFFGLLWWQWLAFPLVVVLAWLVGRTLRATLWWMLQRLARATRNTWDDQLMDSLGPPVTLVLTILAFAVGFVLMQPTRAAMEFIATFTRPAMAFAFFWAMFRSAGVLVAFVMTRAWAANSASARNLLSVGSNLLRGAIIGAGILAVVAALGYPIGTVLAGLGIGGLALAFGAQKTVENVFGSIALAVDQPFRIGDFVRVGDFIGTVEDIGFRSTRFRTLDRTLVSMPNGVLAEQRLESFQARDRMRLDATIGLTYSTTRDQVATVLEGLERVLRDHPRIWADDVVVRFKGFGASSLDIEIMAWFEVPTWGDFRNCRQDVLLGFMRVVEDAGASFAFPTRTVHLVQEAPAGSGSA